MEDLTPEYEKQMKAQATDIIELFDIFLTDGTHLRFNSANQDIQLIDFEE